MTTTTVCTNQPHYQVASVAAHYITATLASDPTHTLYTVKVIELSRVMSELRQLGYAPSVVRKADATGTVEVRVKAKSTHVGTYSSAPTQRTLVVLLDMHKRAIKKGASEWAPLPEGTSTEEAYKTLNSLGYEMSQATYWNEPKCFKHIWVATFTKSV